MNLTQKAIQESLRNWTNQQPGATPIQRGFEYRAKREAQEWSRRWTRPMPDPTGPRVA
jgi:hypothetical protein